MVTFQNILAFITGGALGVLLGYFIEHRRARSQSLEAFRKSEYNKAAATFYAAFVHEIYSIHNAISTGGTDDSGSILVFENRTDELMTSIKKAKRELTRHLPAAELKGFNAAWKDYTGWQRDSGDALSDRNENMQKLLRHIKCLMQYAKPK